MGFLRLLESVRVPALDTLFSGITYFGDELAFLALALLLFWCVVRIAYITIVMGIVHEIQYIYMAYPITWSLSSIVYFLYYHFSDWVHGFDAAEKRKIPS